MRRGRGGVSAGGAVPARVCLLVLLPLLATGCRGATTDRDAPADLRIGIGVGTTAREAAVEGVGALLFSESLLTRQTDGRTVEGLATKWQWEDGGRTLRLHLKPGVRLHDDSILTAGLVVQRLNQSLAEQPERPLGFAYVTDVSAADDQTVVVRLSQPDFFLLPELTGLKIVRPDAPDVATGPFKIATRSPAFDAVRFDKYHGGAPAIRRVSIVTYDTQRAAWAALLRGEVNALQEVSRDTVEFANGATNVRTYPSLQSFYIPLVFNQRHPLLARLEIRRALNDGIDRAAIVQGALRGHAQVAEDPIWPLHWAYSAPAKPHRYDPEGARSRLDAAGLPLGKGGREGNQARFAIRCLFWNEDSTYERIALMIQRQLFEIGVDLKLEPATLKQIRQRADAGDFDTLLMRANAGRSLDFTYRFWHSSGPQAPAMWRAGYTAADELLDRLRTSTSEEETRRIVAQLGARFREDVPAAFIVWPQVTRAVEARFDVGVPPGKSLDPFANIGRWRPADGAK